MSIHSILIKDGNFLQLNRPIVEGDEIRFVNEDDMPHQILFDNGWRSQEMGQWDSWFTPELSQGTYKFGWAANPNFTHTLVVEKSGCVKET